MRLIGHVLDHILDYILDHMPNYMIIGFVTTSLHLSNLFCDIGNNCNYFINCLQLLLILPYN